MSTSKPRRSPKPAERQRDSERTRRLILEAGTAEFAGRGFAGARIATIAARAGVNQQMISYYFDGKEGLYKAISEQWREREAELVPPGTPMSEQVRSYALEPLNNPEGVRLLVWGGLEHTAAGPDPDHVGRQQRLLSSVEEIRACQEAGHLPAELDPPCVLVMLMAAAMATTVLPHVIEGVCGVDAHSSEFAHHYADQLSMMARYLGLGPA